MSNQIQNVKEKKNYTYKKLLNKYFELEVKKKKFTRRTHRYKDRIEIIQSEEHVDQINKSYKTSEVCGTPAKIPRYK